MSNRLSCEPCHSTGRHMRSKIPKAIKSILSFNSNPKIAVEVRKVSANVSELQKTMALETAARNDLEVCVEQLKIANAAIKRCLTQEPLDPRGHRLRRSTQSFHFFVKSMPCNSLMELKRLHEYIQTGSNFPQWTKYIKLLGGNDFNSSIKNIFDTIMSRSVQKQLSWTGNRTSKPSLKSEYKDIVDGIHVGMENKFKDYTIALGEGKMKSILKNASKK